MPSIARNSERQPIWVTKDGRRLLLKEMPLSHLKNAIAKIKRENWRKHYLRYLEAELASRRMKDENGQPLLTPKQIKALRDEEEEDRYKLREV